MQVDREAAKKAAYAYAVANDMGEPGDAEDEAEAIQLVCDLVGHYFAASPALEPVGLPGLLPWSILTSDEGAPFDAAGVWVDANGEMIDPHEALAYINTRPAPDDARAADLEREVQRLTNLTSRFPDLMARILAAKDEPIDVREQALVSALQALPEYFHRYQWEADAKPAFGEKFVRNVAGNNGHGMGRQWVATTPPNIKGLAEYIAAANPDTIAMLLAEVRELRRANPAPIVCKEFCAECAVDGCCEDCCGCNRPPAQAAAFVELLRTEAPRVWQSGAHHAATLLRKSARLIDSLTNPPASVDSQPPLGGQGDPLRTAVATLLDYIGCYAPEHREAATVEAVRFVMGLTRFRYAEVQKHLDQVADIAAQLEKEKRDPARAVAFTYVNWRGEVGERRAVPISIHYGATEWHPESQWLMRAFDLDKQAERDFAVKDMSILFQEFKP